MNKKWEEYGELVLNSMANLDKRVEILEKDFVHSKVEMAQILMKNSLISGITTAIITLIGVAIMYYSHTK